MYKKLFLIGFSVVTFSIVSMENNNNESANFSLIYMLLAGTLNDKASPDIDFGHTPLHFVAMLPEEINEYLNAFPKEHFASVLKGEVEKWRANLPMLDIGAARMAAYYYYTGNKITVQNKKHLTPFNYAIKNKEQLPQVFKAFAAMHIIDTTKVRLPKDAEGNFDFEQLKNTTLSTKDFKMWEDSEELLCSLVKDCELPKL